MLYSGCSLSIGHSCVEYTAKLVEISKNAKGPLLSRSNLNIILNGEILNDEHIFAAQKLLKKQFPMIQGFQDTVLAQTKSFKSFPCNSIVIHHTGNCHWITSSSVGGIVTVYDSLFTNITKSTQNQLVMCYHKPGGSHLMKIELPQVQTQKGTKDCGLFAIAFSYEIASGNTNVCSVRFNQRKMRDHLIKSFEKQKMEAFPKSTFGIKKK